MANIRQINVGGTTYDIAPSTNPNANTDGIFYITCDSGSDTSTIKSNLTLTSYYTGLKVVLYYTLNSVSSTSVELNINNLGAKRIYKFGTAPLTEGFKPNSMHFLCYNGSAFIENSYEDSNATYDDPVSPNSYTLIASTDFYPNTLIFKGTDGIGYKATETSRSIDPDWGLGYVTQYTEAKTFTNPNTVFQQYMVNSSSGGIPYLYNYNYGEELYLCCDFVNNQIYSLNYIGTYNECQVHHSSHGSGDFTYIYLGIVASIDGSLHNQAGHVLALDLSNHDFITVGALSAQDQKVAVKAINGRLIHGSDSSTDGWDGSCHTAQTYSYLSNRTVDPNIYHYPCTVTMYENKAFLYTVDTSERGAYVAYAHVTVHNDDNVQHTVEISLCADNVDVTSTEPVTPVWSEIKQKTATYLEIPPYRSATVHMTTPIEYDYDYKDGSPRLLGYGFVIRNDDNEHCSIIGAHEASIIVRPATAPGGIPDASAVHQAGRQFYRAAQFDVGGKKPQYAWCSSGVINNPNAAGTIIYTSDDTPAVTPSYTTVDGSTVIAVFKGINPSTGGAVTGTTCGVYQIGTSFINDGNSYSYVSVPIN